MEHGVPVSSPYTHNTALLGTAQPGLVLASKIKAQPWPDIISAQKRLVAWGQAGREPAPVAPVCSSWL